MSSPRKYSSPYLSGLPGLPSSTSSAVTGTVKTKKKSKTSLVKLSESAQVVKQIQDGIWHSAASAKTVSSRTSAVAVGAGPGSGVGDYQGNSSPFPRRKESNNNFNDASCGDIPDIQKMGIKEEEISRNELEIDKEEDKNEEEEVPKWDGSEYRDGDGEAGGATSLIICKDSILLKQGSLGSSRSTTEVYHEDWGVPQEEENEEENDNEELDLHEGNRPVHLRSILKKPSVYYTKPSMKFEGSKKGAGGKTVSKGKFGRPNKEVKEVPGTLTSGGAGRGIRLRNAQGSISNLEMHSKLMGNNKGPVKSPRKKSKVNTKAGVEENKERSGEGTGGGGGGPKKAVRFSSRVDVHSVPYEPRGISGLFYFFV